MTDTRSPTLAYRPDIDGLRAIAVLSVLAFHARVPFLTGGFTGVDVFFVISGYLITQLLINEYQGKGSIGFVDFWARRVRRLAPALLLTVATVLLLSLFSLQRVSGEVGALTKAAAATLLINANHFFLLGSGDYFGAAAETNPMLHMWSLSVEEQFYVAWPLLLFAALKYGGLRFARVSILVALLVSLGISCYLTAFETSKAFYLMPSRAWELLAGATMAFHLSANAQIKGRGGGSVWLAVAGLGLIAGSAIFLTGASAFPGPAAIIPVAGACLLLVGNSGNASSSAGTWPSKLMGCRAMVYVGKISYPLYLWHWPVLVLTRSTRLYEPSLARDFLGLLIACLLAVATYELVEKNAWKTISAYTAKRTVLLGFIGSGVVLSMALAVGGWARYGWGYTDLEQRLDASRKDTPAADCMFGDKFPQAPQLDRCFPKSSTKSVLLWGDSYANHWRPALARAGESIGVELATLTMNACKPLSGQVGNEACSDFNRQVLENLPLWKNQRGLVGLVLSARWPEGMGTLAVSVHDRANWKPGHFFHRRAKTQAEALSYFEAELRNVFEQAARNQLKILLVMPSPVLHYEAAHCLSILSAAQCNVTENEMEPYAAPAEKILRKVAAEFPAIRIIDPKKFMCLNGVCPVVMDELFIYTDDEHVSRSFSVSRSAEFLSGMAWLTGR